MARETDQKSYEHELGTAGKKQMVVVPPSDRGLTADRQGRCGVSE